MGATAAPMQAHLEVEGVFEAQAAGGGGGGGGGGVF
jgi:hypothetical protein